MPTTVPISAFVVAISFLLAFYKEARMLAVALLRLGFAYVEDVTGFYWIFTPNRIKAFKDKRLQLVEKKDTKLAAQEKKTKLAEEKKTKLKAEETSSTAETPAGAQPAGAPLAGTSTNRQFAWCFGKMKGMLQRRKAGRNEDGAMQA
jgi:ribosomal protein L14E/L6E/L27E